MKSCISLYSYWKLVIAKKMTHYQVIDTIKDLGIDAVELQYAILNLNKRVEVRHMATPISFIAWTSLP